jgi:CubicO group peptidase (beta-lactamase class C family)
MAMHRGDLSGNRVVSEAWMQESVAPPAFNAPRMDEATKTPRTGYGYQWWLLYGEDHAFQAIGIYGQNVYVNPAKHIVIAQFSALPKPSGGGNRSIGRPHDAIVEKLAR